MAEDDALPGNQRKWVRWGWFGSAILLPALFAGLFSLIPNLFDRFMAPEPRLEYSIISSPSVSSAGSFKSIYSLTLINSGGAKLTGIAARVNLTRGAVEQANLDTSVGEQSRLLSSPSGSQISIASMFPSERSTATFLVSTPSPGIKPAVSVRSSEVLGQVSEPSERKEPPMPPWFALFPALGVVMASLMSATVLRRSHIAKKLGLALPPRVAGIDRSDVIGLVATYVDIPQLDETLVFRTPDVTYIRFAEVLLRTYEKETGQTRERCVAGLKALAIAPYIHDRSRTIILQTLGMLDPSLDVGSFDAVRKNINDMGDYRREVRAIFGFTGISSATA